MQKIVHSANTRGEVNFGWLHAKYSFSFGNFYDPNRLGFGLLRVLNDDTIGPGMGFGKHPHQNMEIVTIPQSGALKHQDSMGNEGIISEGEIQVMSAGSGVQHSEVNASQDEELKLFQIWVFPDTEEVTPRYDQKKIAPLLKPNELTAVIKPKKEANDTELWVHQNAYFNIGDFTEDTHINYTVKNQGNGMYVLVIHGTTVIDNNTLNTRDAIGIWDTNTISLDIEKGSRILLLEIPMN